MKKRKVFLLIGLPGAGKTTWTKKYVKENPDTLVVSRDDIRLHLHSGTYIFETELEPVIKSMSDNMISDILFSTDKNLIIDETNGRILNRKHLIDLIKETEQFNTVKKCKIIGVVFTETKNNLRNRMKNNRGYTKQKWKDVIDGMKNSWEAVKKKEGFHQIIKV